LIDDRNKGFSIKKIILLPFNFLILCLLIISSFFCHFQSEISYFLSNKNYGTIEENRYYKKLKSLNIIGKKKHEIKQKRT
jgi:hypothetical protein